MPKKSDLQSPANVIINRVFFSALTPVVIYVVTEAVQIRPFSFFHFITDSSGVSLFYCCSTFLDPTFFLNATSIVGYKNNTEIVFVIRC